MSKDIQGRAYLAISDARPGARVEADGDFTCLAKGSRIEIESCAEGLFVPCCEGRHFLEGQLSENGKFFVGLYPVAPVAA